MSVSLSGVATGIDTSSIVKQLIALEGRRLALYKLDKKGLEGRTSLFTELSGKISVLKSSANSLSSIKNLQMYSSKSSDSDILSVTAGSDASAGSHSLEIKQLATSETWIHNDANTSFGQKTDYVGGGTFIYSYNYQERAITTVENETTLEDFVNLINRDNGNPGVTASLLYQNGKYRLMLTGQDTGTDYQISVNSTNTQKIVSGSALTVDGGSNATGSTKIVDLVKFSGDIGSGSTKDRLHITGTNHDGTETIDHYIDVTKYTTIDQVISGINQAFTDSSGNRLAMASFSNGKICLTDVTSGTSLLELKIDFIPGTDSTAALELSDFGSVLTASSAFTNGTGNATLVDKITELQQFSFTTLGGFEKVTITGTNKTGSAVVAELAIDADTTVQNLIDQINAVFTGSTASLVDGKIVLTDNISGASSTSINLTFDAGTDSDAIFTLPSQFTKAFGGTNGGTVNASLVTFNPVDFLETQSAQNSMFKIDGYPPGADEWIERNSNSISDAMSGLTFELHATTAIGETVQFTISQNKNAISGKVQSLVKAYNDLVAYLKDKTEYKSATKQMGELSDFAAIRLIKGEVSRSLLGALPGFNNNTDLFIQPSDIGLKIKSDGTLELDSSKLDEAIKDNFAAVLDVLGAAASGVSDSGFIDFYGSSEKYTKPGKYEVQVTVNDGVITTAKVRFAGETEFRDMTIKDNMITGNSSFDSNGNGPLYAENGLQLTVDLSKDGTYSANIRVKQGFAGQMENYLAGLVKTDGVVDTSKKSLDTKITRLGKTIEKEEKRLEREEKRLKLKYSRLEAALANIQQQFGALAMMVQ